MLKVEFFRPLFINGQYTRYAIGDLGSLYSFKYNRFLKCHIDNHGYYRTWIWFPDGTSKAYRIHQLVAMMFIPNPENKPHINHIDGNKLNNQVDNLEWCTPKENCVHAVMNNLKKSMVDIHTVKRICELLEKGGYSNKEIADIVGSREGVVESIKKHHTWTSISKDYDFKIRKHNDPLTEETVRMICQMIESGDYTDTEIGEMLNVRRGIVNAIHIKRAWRSISKEYNIDDHDKRTSPITIEKVHEICKCIERNPGMHTKDIAKICGVKNHIVIDIVRKKTWVAISKQYNIYPRVINIRFVKK